MESEGVLGADQPVDEPVDERVDDAADQVTVPAQPQHRSAASDTNGSRERVHPIFLDPPDHDHVRRLMGRWGMLADLSFSDLLMYRRAEGGGFVVVGQVRATTAQTLYVDDRVGQWASESALPLVAQAFASGRVARGTSFVRDVGRVNVQAIPVRRDHQTLAVLSREHGPKTVREHGDLEKRYLEVFDRLAQMITTGEFPFASQHEEALSNNPRVGDGVLILDARGVVQYVSPNAVSALNRSGVSVNVRGRTLPEAGLDQLATRVAFRTKQPTMEESTIGEVILAVRCVPLLVHGEVTGAFVLLQDVTELRSRDRLLLSKDATIREIHHRVKNNLQTISSLLRLQGRRLTEPSARDAINESVQRIRSIAVVHEILSTEHADDVDFAEIARGIVRMLDEITGEPISVKLIGDSGRVPSATATPLAVVVNELIQNAADHAFPKADLATLPKEANRVEVRLNREGDHLTVEVVDNGVGLQATLPAGDRPGLGMSIVTSLVESELSGEMTTEPSAPGEPRPGNRVRISMTVPEIIEWGRLPGA